VSSFIGFKAQQYVLWVLPGRSCWIYGVDWWESLVLYWLGWLEVLGLGCGVEAYEGVCRVLGRLCPRLVPAPLWGLSLAHLARLDPVLGEAICSGCGWVVERLYTFWFGLERGGRCSVCGGLGGVDVDEDWRYYVCGGAGLAVLSGIRLLCRRCHLAKHVGFASLVGRRREALEQLARINGVRLDLVEKLVGEAFRVWERLSSISKWRIVVEDVEGLRDVRSEVEKLLNTMYVERLSIEKRWLVYRSNRQYYIERIAIEETLELVAKAFSGVEKDRRLASRLVSLAKNVLKEHKILVLEHELMLAIEATISRIGSLKLEKIRDIETFLEALEGKWIVFVNENQRGKIFTHLIHRLKSRELDYLIKTPANRTKGNREYPVTVHVPSFLALNLVAKVGNTIKHVLEEYGINKPIIFKPNILAEKPKTKTIKPYIYKIQATNNRG